MQAAPTKPGATAEGALSFWRFFSECFVPLQRLSLPLKHQHKEICDVLQKAVLGDLRKDDGTAFQYVVINMPPRIGKTKILEALSLWLEAYFSDAQIIYTGYSSTLVERSIRYISGVLLSEWYQALFAVKPGNVMRAELLTTAENGTIYGAGVGASITGFGAGLKRPAGGFIAIDDPAKPDAALSTTESDNVQQWFETTLKSRRNSDSHCPIIICAQRLSPEDLVGYVLKTYPDDTYLVKFPAVIDGVYQFPETVGAATLKTLETTRYGRFVYASQYQQEPVALDGNLIPVDKFARYDHELAKLTRWEKLIIPIDTALKIKQANDFSACALWGLYQKRAYLIDLMHGKWESPELLQNVIKFWEKWQSVEGWPRPRIVIEEKAAGTPLLQNLNRQRVPAVGIERDIDKVRRVQSILPYIETGCVVIPKDNSPHAQWIAKWISEHASFTATGTHAHDDMVDTTVDAVEGLLGKPLSSFDVLMNPRA